MNKREFEEDCNKEIRRMIQEADKEIEEEEKKRIFGRFRPENNIEIIIKALTAFNVLYDSTPEEWNKNMIKYEHTPTEVALRHIGKLFHLLTSLKYETKRDLYYNLCKIIGDEGYYETPRELCYDLCEFIEDEE